MTGTIEGMNKFKVTKKIKAELKVTAAGMPPIKENIIAILSKEKELMRVAENKKIARSHKVIETIKTPVSHYNRVVKAYEENGWPGVLEYHSKVMAIYNKQQSKLKKDRINSEKQVATA